MKAEELYQSLKELAEKLDITVSEQNFRTAGIKVESGLCRVKGRHFFIMDKHIPVQRKADILGDCLGKMPSENIYVVPAVREFLDKGSGVRGQGSEVRGQRSEVKKT